MSSNPTIPIHLQLLQKGLSIFKVFAEYISNLTHILHTDQLNWKTETADRDVQRHFRKVTT